MKGNLPPIIFDLSYDEIEQHYSKRLATQVYRSVYRMREPLSESLAQHLGELGKVEGLKVIAVDKGARSTKYLFALRDGYGIESVIISRHDGYSACVSSQVGCAVQCRFCASGQIGVKRNLTPGEIVAQILALRQHVNRILFMGIGEPLNNYDNVLKAIRILRDRRGLDFPTSGITISTIGPLDGLKKLREEHLKINLTLSLHSIRQSVRDQLVPGARKWPVQKVLDACWSWANRHNREVTIAYLLLPGINDTKADILGLVNCLGGQPARVNLMRLNPIHNSQYRRASDYELNRFAQSLKGDEIKVTVRDTQGRDIKAACGQLWLRDVSSKSLCAMQKDARRSSKISHHPIKNSLIVT